MHLFFGPIDVEARAAEVESRTAAPASERVSVADLARRVEALEAELAELKQRLGEGD